MKFSALGVILALGLGSPLWAQVQVDPSAMPARKLAPRHHAHPAGTHHAHPADRHRGHAADKHKAHSATRHAAHPTDRHHKEHAGA